MKRSRTAVEERCWEEATKDCLPAELAERKLKGEHPSGSGANSASSVCALVGRANIPASYISEIENYLKPGSVSAYFAFALDLPIEPVLLEIVG